MKISIVIPVYNSQKYLERCLDSVLMQTYKDLEVILINDGSIDDSKQICDFYSSIDNRINVRHTPNKGVSSARNLGLSLCTGEYIYFLDSDDYLNVNTIEIFKNRMGKSPDILAGVLNRADEKSIYKPLTLFKEKRFQKEDLLNSRNKFEYFFGKSFGASAGNKMYRHDFLRKSEIKFDEEIYFGEDFLFNLKVYVNASIVELINDETYYYFYNMNSVTNVFKKNLTKNYILMFERFHSYLTEIDAVDENKDLLSFLAFTAIDNSCLNTFQHSTYRISSIHIELSLFYRSDKIGEHISYIASGKYANIIPRKDWKYFARVFSVFYSKGMFFIASVIMYFRFCVKRKSILMLEKDDVK